MKPAIFAAIIGILWTASANAGEDNIYKEPQNHFSWGKILSSQLGFNGFEKSYALVIGVSKYDHFVNLPTVNDPLNVKDYLLNEAGFDYVHVLTEEKVTLQRVNDIMVDTIPTLLDSNDRFVFYWSGHGVTRQVGNGDRGYIPVKASPNDKFGRMISMQDIKRWDDLQNSRQTLYLLDACFSGLAGVASKAGHRLTEIEQLARQSSHLLTAGTANEETIATDQLGGSVFTAAVLDGLRGKADSANAYPRDGVVTLRELQGYVRKRVDQERRAAGWRKTITPQLRDLATSDGEFFFLTSEQKIARLKGAGEKPNGDFAYGRPLSTGPDHVRSKGGKTKIESFSVHFGSDSASLSGDTALLLKEVVNACSEGAIGLTGHTGLDGTAAYNLAISSRRLNVVRRELISLGMPESSFDNSVLAMGEDEQKAPPFTPSGDALNHRVEIVCVN